MSKILDIVLLLALPASGKSEVRRYLANLSPEACQNDFHMGPTVQLDDFPYVHMMRRIDDELAKLGQPRVFFHSGERPFQNTWDWGTLIHLVNEDYEDLLSRQIYEVPSAADHLFSRLDAAGQKATIAPRLAKLSADIRSKLAASLEKEARELLDEKHANYPASLNGKTLVIEFARGGPDGSTPPLAAPLGYQYSLAELHPAILEKAAILYVWVTPEESRRKNFARTDPNDPGSILHHGVPIEVMLNDYGCDDMTYLESVATVPGTVPVKAHGKQYDLRIGRFDNRVDKTSFLRVPVAEWPADAVAAVHNGIKSAMDKLID